MTRTKLGLILLPMLATAAVFAQQGHGRDGDQRGGEPNHGQRDDQRGEPMRGGDSRGNHDDGRRDDGRRDEGRRTDQPRVWDAPRGGDRGSHDDRNRWDHGDRGDRDDRDDRGNRGDHGQFNREPGRDSNWNRGSTRPYWRDDRSYSYYRSPNYSFYRDYARDRGYNRGYNSYFDRNYGGDYGGYYGSRHDNRRWQRGERLPLAYYARDRWERDYWRYDLYDPRDGCGWVRSDGDALLVVLATGLVLDAVYDIYR